MTRLIPLATCVAVLVAPLTVDAQPYGALSDQVRAYVSVSETSVALRNVRVVDGTGAAPRENQTILIEDGRIAAVGPSADVRVPPGARSIDLAGHTLVPAFVGVHNHMFYMTRGRSIQLPFSAPRLYLASGVTTVRTTGSSMPYQDINMKRAIDRGEAPGPRMHVTGPYVTGSGGMGIMVQVTTPEDARRVVGYWADEGVTWIKVYTTISRDALRAVIEEAHARGLKVTGHLCSVSFREAAELGIDNLEHGFFTNSDYVTDKVPDQCPSGMRSSLLDVAMDGPAVEQTIRDIVGRDVAMSSTLAVYELSYPERPPIDDRVMEAMASDARQEYLTARQEISQQSDRSTMPELFRRAQEFERAFVRAGGLLGAGVDPTGMGGALPGLGDQRNFELLVEGGFTPVEAVQIMSLNGARILDVDDALGSIEPGKMADLVVIRGDPMTSPRDIRNVTTVFKDGVGYDSAKLLASVKGLVGTR